MADYYMDEDGKVKKKQKKKVNYSLGDDGKLVKVETDNDTSPSSTRSSKIDMVASRKKNIVTPQKKENENTVKAPTEEDKELFKKIEKSYDSKGAGLVAQNKKGIKVGGSVGSTPLFLAENDIEKNAQAKHKEADEGFFKAGAFEDGVDGAGDAALKTGKTAASTIGDIGLNIFKGAANTVEGVTDLVQYGIAGAADLVGADEFADDLRRVTKRGVINDTFAPMEKTINKNSLLGDTSDAVAQGVGQVGLMILTGGLGEIAGLGTLGTTVLTSGTMFASGMGSGMGEAYAGGATDGEAVAYGAMSGAADAITELIFGGLGKAVNAVGFSKGLSSADDMLAKALTEKIQSTLAKNAVQMGVKMTGEGFEEFLAGVLQAASKKATYLSEEDWKKIIADENLLEQFIVGALTSGFSQAPGAIRTTMQGTDFITGRTDVEDSVINKEVENRVEEKRKNGEIVNGKDKNKIYDEVVEEFEKGYLSTDVIESVLGESLGGESYKAYKDTYDSENALTEREKVLEAEEEKLREEFNELNRMKHGDMTGEQTDRREELRSRLDKISEERSKLQAQIEDTKANSKLGELREKLGSEMRSSLEKSKSRLAESYYEVERRRQAFEADVSTYSEAQRDTIQRAIDSGILNNSRKTHEFVDLIAKISADKGVSFDFANNEKLKKSGFAIDGKTVNGFVTKDGITINIQSAKALNSVVGHEITHVLEGTKLYSELQSALFAYAKSKGEYDSRLEAITKLYEVVEGADVNAELTADLVGDYLFTDADFVNHLSAKNRNIFEKIYDEIKYLCKIVTSGSKEARQLEKIKKTFDEAYKAQKNTDTTDGVRYSLSSDKNGDYVKVDVQQDIFDGKSVREMQETARKLIKDNFKGQVLPVGKDGKAYINKRSAEEFAYPANRRMNEDLKEAKMRSAPELDNLLAVSKFIENQVDDGRHPQATGGWDIYSTRFEVAGMMFSGEVKIMVTDRGYVFYDITKIERLPVNGGQTETNSAAASGNLSTDSISKNEVNVNRKNFLSAEGEQIAPAGNYNVYGKDIALEDDIAPPIPERVTRTRGETKASTPSVTDDDFAPIRKDVKRTLERKVDLKYLTEDDIVPPASKGIQKKYISLEEFVNSDSSVWKNVAYEDEETKSNIMRETHKHMVEDGAVVEVSADVRDNVDAAYPDLRGMKKKERTPILKEAMQKLKNNLRQFLGGFKNQTFEFNVDGKLLEAKLYNTGIKEVLEKITKEKAGMLYSTEEIFKNARYLYSTPDYDGDPNVYRWNYFYTPVKIGDDTVGVRIAVRDTATPRESQIYNWGIKKDTSLDGVGRGTNDRISHGVSSDVSNDSIADVTESVKRNDVVLKDADIVPGTDNEIKIKTTNEKLAEKRGNYETELESNRQNRKAAKADYEKKIEAAQREYNSLKNKNSGRANTLLRRIDKLTRIQANIDADYAKRISSIEGRIEKTEAELQKDHTRADNLERAYARIDRELETRKAELAAEFEPRRATLEGILLNRGKYISDEAGKLYDELSGLKKGVRASKDLGYLLDLGYDWNSLKTALAHAKRFPNRVINETSEAESAVRELLAEKYDDKTYELSELEAEQKKAEEQLDAEAEELRAAAKTAVQRKVKQEQYREEARELMGDTLTWRDKKHGISYSVNTLARNLRDIVKDSTGKQDIAKADRIYEWLQGTYNHNEAELNRESARIKNPYAKMKITKHENVYTQMLGELRHNPDTELTADYVNEYYQKNRKDINTVKVDRIIEMARKTYDSLLQRVNTVLREQGMKEIPYRKGYFPHFTNPKQGFLAKLLNWKVKDDTIPTDIAGLTEDFKPNRSWQSFNKQRVTDDTDYNFAQGLDTYVRGALDWIYHIEDIQKNRAFENEIRYQHSEQGIKDKIDALKKSDVYDAEEFQDQIDLIFANATNPLNNFVQNLRTRTNTLAGKKSSLDRGMESQLNRKSYSVMTNISNRVNANMVVGSISSALTNFIPITQSWAEVNPARTLVGIAETVRNTFKSDGMVEKSDFLTNRLRQADNLYKTGWDKASDKAGILMNVFDNFTAQTIWRSKYSQNLAKGMSEVDAIHNADRFAEGVLAGRSRGNMPTIFDSKNPIAKIFTAFQLEVANQYGYAFKDVPQNVEGRNAAEKIARLTAGYAGMFVGAYLYNALFSQFTGRNAAFDPIRILQELLGDLGFGGDDDEEEEVDYLKALSNFTDNVMDELPFVSGLSGGGRIPIGNALPYGEGLKESIFNTLEDFTDEDTTTLEKFKKIGSEWLNPVYYVAMPFGGGQLKKMAAGLSMFDDDLPVSGSYTDSGNLRFPVEDTLGNKVQAALFGQWASGNARDYFENERSPLNEKQTQEYIDSGMSIQEYWDYRGGLSGLKTLEEKADYINSLDIPLWQKNLFINNIATRKEEIDMKDYGEYDSLEEFDFANEYPEKYAFFTENGISYEDYDSADKDTKSAYNWAAKDEDRYAFLVENGVSLDDPSAFDTEEKKSAWTWAYKNPEKYAVSKAVTGDVVEYRSYTSALSKIHAGDDTKTQKTAYINSLDIEYGQKCILFKSQYKTDDTYNNDILTYLNKRNDITYENKKTILAELGASVDSKGNVHWE